jgi:hypothetical protein
MFALRRVDRTPSGNPAKPRDYMASGELRGDAERVRRPVAAVFRDLLVIKTRSGCPNVSRGESLPGSGTARASVPVV